MNKITVKRIDGKFYEYELVAMGREVALLTRKEFIQLYNDMTDFIVDDEELWWSDGNL